MIKAIARTGLIISLCSLALPAFLTGAAASQGEGKKADAAANESQGSNKNKNSQIIHLLNRITLGPGPGDLEKVKSMGVDAYIKQQLHPQSIQMPEKLQKLSQADALKESPAKLFLTYGRPALKTIAQKGSSDKEEDKKELQKILRETYQRLYTETAGARLARGLESPAQLQELMTDFWYNHFNISIDKNLDHLWVGSFEEKAIRPHALGKFRDLLGATAHHAAMLFYLDNWQNTAAGANGNAANRRGGRFKGINENYARELMELHTLGVDGGYTQKDVQELARVLTGLGLPPGAGGGFGNQNKQQRRQMAFDPMQMQDPQMQALQIQRNARSGVWNGQGQQLPPNIDLNDSMGSFFDSRRHDYGEKTVVGYRITGKGEEEIEEVLDILAKHPSTAKHISYKLAQYFVADNPPQSLVDKLAKRFSQTNGDIALVMETLLKSPEFWDLKYQNAKFKSPYRYLLSSLRATKADLQNIQPSMGLLTQLGMPMYKCLTPDGYKNTKEAWLNPDNLINRLNFATAYGYGRFPGVRPGIYDPAVLADCIGPVLSDKTIDAVMNSPQNLRISLLLGSPEFMKY